MEHRQGDPERVVVQSAAVAGTRLVARRKARPERQDVGRKCPNHVRDVGGRVVQAAQRCDLTGGVPEGLRMSAVGLSK
jgi:hypothetical protein